MPSTDLLLFAELQAIPQSKRTCTACGVQLKHRASKHCRACWRMLPGVTYRRVNKNTYAHIPIAERALGHALPVGAQVHHVDGDPRNNANSNLVICQDQKYHHLLHVRQRIRAHGGNPNTESWCWACETIKPRDAFYLMKNGPRAGSLTTVCRPCTKERCAKWRRDVAV